MAGRGELVRSRVLVRVGAHLDRQLSLRVFRAVFDPALGLRQWIHNFDSVADAVLARLRTEADVDPALRELLQDLEQLRGTSRPRAVEHTANPVALPIHIRRDGIELRYFTTLTTLGTPLDVTAQELRIEGYFPMDTATEEFAHTLLRRHS